MHRLTTLEEIATYHEDTNTALRHYYSPYYLEYQSRFAGYFLSEVSNELITRIAETEVRSVLAILARVEAAFRRDYIARATSKNADLISIALRKLHAAKGRHARLEDEILSIWREHLEPADRKNISNLRSMLKYRHWLAHGRYWNQGRLYSYQDVYLLADVLLTSLSLQS